MSDLPTLSEVMADVERYATAETTLEAALAKSLITIKVARLIVRDETAIQAAFDQLRADALLPRLRLVRVADGAETTP